MPYTIVFELSEYQITSIRTTQFTQLHAINLLAPNTATQGRAELRLHTPASFVVQTSHCTTSRSRPNWEGDS